MLRRFRHFANRISLRTQSALLAVAICALAVGLTAATSGWIARREAMNLTRAQLATLASAMAEQLDLGMFERFREIRNVARLSLVKEQWTGEPHAVREILDQLKATLPDYAWIGFARPDGRVHAATGGLLEGVSVAQRAWFIDGFTGMTVKDVHPAKLLAKKLGPSPDVDPLRFVDIASPVLGADGRRIGVLGAHLSWSWAQDLRRQLLRPVGPDAAIEIWVLASDGAVLLGPQLDGKPFAASLINDVAGGGETSLVDESGPEPMLSALAATSGMSPYPGLGWTVVARQPLAVATASADRLFWSIMAVGCLVTLFAAIFGWRFAGRVTEPVRRLALSADRIGRDESVRTLARVGGSRDVLLLSSALRALLRRVGAAQERASAATRDRQAAEDQAGREALRLNRELDVARSLAAHDPLTGLLNRRGFALYADDAWQAYCRHGRPLAAFVVDLDHFKAINDSFGHAIGDTVLQRLGRVMSETARATDKVARFGGEEFVALLTDTEREGAVAMAERLRQRVTETFDGPQGVGRPVTVSVGIALARSDDRDLSDVIERADRALYAAKLKGRNRVEVAGDGPLRNDAAA